jgi:hypothetical protein
MGGIEQPSNQLMIIVVLSILNESNSCVMEINLWNLRVLYKINSGDVETSIWSL